MVPVRNAVRLGGIGVGLVAAAALVGCASATQAAAPAAQQPGIQAYVNCLSSNGVTLPSGRPSGGPRPSASPRPSFSPRPSGSPRPGGSTGPRGGFGGGFFGTQAPAGVDQATWDKAMQACSPLRPTAGPSGGADSSQARAYRNCLTEHGVAAGTGPGQLNTTDPSVAAAMAACAVLRPTPTPTSGG
jgi:hypothetical protein